MMKKTMGILCALCSIMICGCTAQNPTKSASNPVISASNPVISDSKPAISASNASKSISANSVMPQAVQIKITPPSGWERNTDSVLQVQYLKNTISFMVKEEKFSSTKLDAVVAEAEKYFTKAFGNIAFNEPQSLTVDKKEAQMLVFSCKVSGMQMKYEYVYLAVGNAVYAITFGGPENSFDALSADYAQILSDIRFE